MEGPVIESNVEFKIFIAGQEFTARQYVGVGHLNVSTSRGELKLVSGDFILRQGEETFVVSEKLFMHLVDEIDLDGFAGNELLDVSRVEVFNKPSLVDIEAKQKRGEKLNAEEEIRLLEGK